MKKKTADVKSVKLKDKFGLKPGVYLTILYALILFLFIFIVGILPDLLHPSRRVTFTSDAYNAAVYVDNSYKGGTPFTAKISAGNHNVTYSVNGVEIDNFNIEVKKGVFFAWLFPRKISVNSDKSLSYEAYKALSSEFLQSVVDYSKTLEYTSVFVYPNLFTEYAKSVLNTNFDYSENLENAFCFISTKEMLSDAKNACSILSFDYDFSSLEESVENNLYKTETPFFVGLSLPYSDSIQIGSFKTDAQAVNGFAVLPNAVSQEMFASFISENPTWSKSNKENLIALGLVDEYYLEGFSETSSEPVVNVSYYAAKAYCSWASKVSKREVFIPSEFQCTTGLNFCEPSNLWEFTSTYYVPNAFENENAVQTFIEENNLTCDVIVKKYSEESIGAFSPSDCSPFVTFRIFWR